MTELEKLQLKYDELERKFKKNSDFTWKMTCKFLSLKWRMGLYIKGSLESLLRQNAKLKPEYKLSFINEKTIVEILKEIEEFEIEADEKM